jgi:hypothetical protein
MRIPLRFTPKSWQNRGFSGFSGVVSGSEFLVKCLYNKQNNTWTLGDMKFIFSFAALTLRTPMHYFLYIRHLMVTMKQSSIKIKVLT